MRGKGRTALDAPNTPHPAKVYRIRAGWLLALVACLGPCGCQAWDEVTSRDFTVKEMFSHPDPMWVLNNTQDGDKRAKAFRSFQEPLAHGGTQQDQDAVVKVLVVAASGEPQALCRIGAIESLRDFKDPRAIQGLIQAYYNAGNFKAKDTVTTIRIVTLQALGNTGDPKALDLLVAVVREPPLAADASHEERDFQQQVHNAAVRAMGHVHTKESAEVLVGLLNSKDDAIKTPAYESLVAATGHHLPPDPKVWDDLIKQSGKDGSPIVVEPSFMDRISDILPVGFWK